MTSLKQEIRGKKWNQVLKLRRVRHRQGEADEAARKNKNQMCKLGTISYISAVEGLLSTADLNCKLCPKC